MTARLTKRLSFNHATQTSLFLVWYVDAECTQPERRKMDREMLAEWLRDIAQHIEGVSLDIENYCTLRLFFDLSTLAGLRRRNLPEAGIRLLFQI